MNTLGIVGAGAMGSGIAQVAATAGWEVRLYDVRKEALVVSRTKLAKILNRQVEKGRMTDQEVKAVTGRIYYVDNLSSFSDVDIVIEAIVENIEIKKSVFAELEQACTDDCILATNTSSLSVTEIAASCKKSERVIGIHFFNPAPLMALVEIVPVVQTSNQVLKNSKAIVDGWGKLTVLTGDTPGFIVNRVARPFYSEALRILDEGIADIATIDHTMTSEGGFKMGPFALMDYIGHDVNYKVTESTWKACYHEPRYKPSLTQLALVKAGFFGKKSGRGFYDYHENAVRPVPSDDSQLQERILTRIITMLINEAADALYLGVATRDDIDLAMTKGVNYPKGLLKWADEIGIENLVNIMDDMYDHYHEERYRCCPLLREMAHNDVLFYPS